jgi:hypothetical protein
MTTVERHHWLNTYAGILDTAFYLSDEELFAVTQIVQKTLNLLRIPERGAPAALPAALSHEVQAGYYTHALQSRDTGVPRPVRHATENDCVASLEAWREALLTMLTTAYPDLGVEERLIVTKVFTDLLSNLGVPQRSAASHPDMVINAYLQVDKAI